MSDLPSPGDTRMSSPMPEPSLNSENSDNSDSPESERLKRIEWKVNAAVAGENLNDTLFAMGSVLAKRFGRTDFPLISHVLSSMMAVIKRDSEFDAPRKRKRRG